MINNEVQLRPLAALLSGVTVIGALFLIRSLARLAGFAPFGSIFGPGNLAVVIVAMAILWAAAKGLGGLSLPALGLSIPNWRRVLGVTVGTIVVTAAVANLAGPILFERLGHADTNGAVSRFHELKNNLSLTIASILFVAWFSAAFCEEVVARGFLLPMFERAFLGVMARSAATGCAVIVQALWFGFMHWNYGPYGAIMALILGIIFGISFLAASRSLLPVMFVHAIPDTMTLLSAYQTS